MAQKRDDKSQDLVRRFAKLGPSTNPIMGTDVPSLELSFVNHLEFSLARDEYSVTPLDAYKSLVLTVRDRLIERWVVTHQEYYRRDAKRVYYLSMEFLIGRLLQNALINLGLEDKMAQALQNLGYNLEDLYDLEVEAGLGNGGLGRLAACFLDSMATLELPAYGYGIRYEYGIFSQKIENGEQIECPDEWLRFGNPWEIQRPAHAFSVKFYGRIQEYLDENGKPRFNWIDTDDVLAIAYDTPVPGYQNNTVNNLRLWAARSGEAFNLDYFNHGDFDRAMADKIESETISRVLYPKDDFFEGRELRLKQEYFLVSATLQDIILRFKKSAPQPADFSAFSQKVAIQLNDSHPSLAIPELMRILIDVEGLEWETAWDITSRTFSYTNHTVLPEALEKWPVELIELVLPRHLEIIYEVNRRFLQTIHLQYPGEPERVRNVSIIEESDPKKVRMARLAIVGSHSINGVSSLHTEILKSRFFRYFYEIWPGKFNNKTNGISQRRWLRGCNPDLADLISRHIGNHWLPNLGELEKLRAISSDKDLVRDWGKIKRKNKVRLAEYIEKYCNISVNVDSIFDVHVKRLHEYKRQLLAVLHVITLYNRIKSSRRIQITPRTVIFAGKAAPGYFMAKLIIRLINAVGEVVNNDPDSNDRLKVVFLANYSVTLAERIIPAADLSEQISMAGTEASGTGNMKLALNGAITIGTLDGANIEIREEVGEEDFFIFGLTAEEVDRLKQTGYDPRNFYDRNQELQKAVDMISSGYFSKDQPDLFKPIVESLLQNDQYLVLADFENYIKCQEKVAKAYRNRSLWTTMSILNTAGMGKFSTDRTIREYADEIWGVESIKIAFP